MPQPGKDINSRMIDLLSLVQLEERLIDPNTQIEEIDLFKMDFTISDKIIETKRTESLNYLRKSLGI
jgi:hypothetical protein